jgi:hypothetical protein
LLQALLHFLIILHQGSKKRLWKAFSLFQMKPIFENFAVKADSSQAGFCNLNFKLYVFPTGFILFHQILFEFETI